MKKLESTWYNMAGVLTSIALVAGAALASVNALTKGPIEELRIKSEQNAISQVLGGGDVKVLSVDTLVWNDCPYIVSDAGDKGMAIKAIDPLNASFGGGLTIMVGFDAQGDIKGYSVLQTNETPGLGAKASTWFQQGGKGCIIGMNPGDKPLTVSKDGGNVDAITASTITSRSFLRAVNAAYGAFKSKKTGESSADGVSGATTHK